MQIRGILIAVTATVLSASGAEAKRGFSMKGFFGSSKSAPAPSATPAASAPKPAAPAAPAPAQAAAPKPPAPATAPAASAAAPAAPTRSNGFIFVSTGGSRPATAGEKKEENRQRLEQLPVSDTTASVNDPANALIKPAGYKAPMLGSNQPAIQGSAPGFKLIN